VVLNSRCNGGCSPTIQTELSLRDPFVSLGWNTSQVLTEATPVRSPPLPGWRNPEIRLVQMSVDPDPVPLKDATLEQLVRAISAKIEAKDLNYTEDEVLWFQLQPSQRTATE